MAVVVEWLRAEDLRAGAGGLFRGRSLHKVSAFLAAPPTVSAPHLNAEILLP